MYTIYGANLHNEAEAAEWFEDRSRTNHEETYDVAMFNEAQKARVRRHLRTTRRHKFYTGPPGVSDTNAGQEVSMLIAENLPNLGGGSYFMSRAIPQFPQVGQERWGQVRCTRLGKTEVAFINIHPTPKPEKETGPERLQEANELGIGWANQQLLLATRLHFQAVVGVDVNVREEWETSRQVKNMIDRHHLRGLWVKRDLLMVTPGLKIVSTQVRDDVLHDHPLLRIEVEPR